MPEYIYFLVAPKHKNKVAVFLFGDDQDAVKKLQQMAGHFEGKTFFTLDDAVEILLDPSAPVPPSYLARTSLLEPLRSLNTSGGYSHWDFPSFSKEARILRTKALIASLSLASYSDDVVCTYSSNVCRLMALLLRRKRESSLRRVHSVDWARWVTS